LKKEEKSRDILRKENQLKLRNEKLVELQMKYNENPNLIEEKNKNVIEFKDL